MKTIKELADELNIDKQRVYRYVKKNCINEVYQQDGIMYISEAIELLIKQQFKTSNVSSNSPQGAFNDTVIDMLKKELDIKNRQISELQKSLNDTTEALRFTSESLHAAQALHAGTIKQQIVESLETEESPKGNGFFGFLRRK